MAVVGPIPAVGNLLLNSKEADVGTVMTNWDSYESIVSAAATALLRAQTLRGRGSQVLTKDGRSLNVLSMVNHRDPAEEFDHVITDGATEAEAGFFFSNEILSILDTKTGERIFHRVA